MPQSAPASAALITRLGGRRFLLTVGCGLVTSILCWHGKINGAVYATVIVATVGAYITGNTIQKTQQAALGDGA